MSSIPAHAQYSPKWQTRFNFFDTYGAPNAPGFKEALKALPFKQKMLINFNWYALFFSFIYLGVIGVWRKALVLFGILLVLAVIGVFLPNPVNRGLNIAYGLLAALCANYAFYLDRIKGSTSWNPFEGMRW